MQIQTNHYRELLRTFRAHRKLEGYRDVTHTGAKQLLSYLEQLGIHTLAQVRTGHIKGVYAHLHERANAYGGTLSLHTIRGYLDDMRALLRWAERTGQISISPMAALRFPAPPMNERPILNKAEIKRLYSTCVLPIERLTLSLFYGCGLRASEGGALNLVDVNAQSGLLYVRQGKGGKRRVVPMAPSIIKDIETYINEQRPSQISRHTKVVDRRALALNKIGTRMQGGSYRLLFKALLAQCEDIRQDVSLHSLRHSIATHLLGDGMRIERVRDFLGHSCLESTQIYTRV